jgi:pSer/pThr/pTyr-binding forkhead associated (FHA) protein
MQTAYLELEIIEKPQGVVDVQPVVYFKASGIIGRSMSCDWCLPDPKRLVSSEHAQVRIDGADILLVDVSRNGTFLNRSLSPIGQNGVVKLQSDDQIKIGPYLIKVRVCRQDVEVRAAKKFVENCQEATSLSAEAVRTSEVDHLLDVFFAEALSENREIFSHHLATIEQKEAFFQLLGCLLREMVDGVHGHLVEASVAKHHDQKSDAGMGGDTHRAGAETDELQNPFFAYSSATDVLRALLAFGARPNLLPPLFATREAIDQLVRHQPSVLSPSHLSSNKWQRFDPVMLEQKWFSETNGLAVEVKKRLCWERYCEEFPILKETMLAQE